MAWENVAVETEGPLSVITINRPSAYNALDKQAQLDLMEAIDTYEADDGQWVAILTGAGDKAFCAGMDLRYQSAGGNLFTAPKGFGGMTARPHMKKPIIAAFNGVAMGGGFEIALACDIIIAAAHAGFALPEPRVGLAALAGGIQRLPRDIGLKNAMGMMLTGRHVSAQEGKALGFVNEVAAGAVLDTARQWATDILQCSPLAVQATKEAVYRGMTITPEEGIEAEFDYPAMRRMVESADAVEGPRAALSYEASLEDAHMQARGTYVDHEMLKQAAPAPRFSRTPGAIQDGRDAQEMLEGWRSAHNHPR